MIPIQTTEHLVYFMQCGSIRLGQHDLRFVQNLLQTLMLQHNSITTNQVALFDKLVHKYRRQLSNNGLTPDLLASLTWQSTIVPSDPKFTEAYLSIKDNVIIFKSPFNKKFIDQFRKIQYNSFEWSKDKKMYEATFNAAALKQILTVAHRHYPIINYCPTVSRLLNRLEQYNAKYWTPTLINHRSSYMIAAVNDKVAAAISTLTLSDDPECLSKLASCGIVIDPDITNNNPLLEFAASVNPIVDFKDVDLLLQYLMAIKCDSVTLSGQNGMAIHYRKILSDKIQNIGLELDTRRDIFPAARLGHKNNPVIIILSSTDSANSAYPSNFRKYIRMTNSLPVTIK